MGTRSLTHIKAAGETLTTIYIQCDGYPDGVGADFKEIIGDLEIVNGYTGGRQANGMGCFAAQLIAGLKKGVGNVYVYPPDAKDCGEDYTYVLSDKGGRVYVTCFANWRNAIIYNGFLSEWDCTEPDED